MSLKNHILYFHRVDFPREKLLLPLYSSAHCAFTFINSFDGIGPGTGWQCFGSGSVSDDTDPGSAKNHGKKIVLKITITQK